MNAALGVRFLPEDFRRAFRPPFFAAFLDDFLAEDFRDDDFFLPLLFFFAAILSPGFGDRMRVATESEAPSVRGANYSPVGRKQ
jgi:hypothetical protein